MVYTFDDYKKEVFAKNHKIKELYENEWLKYAIAERIKKPENKNECLSLNWQNLQIQHNL